jgi:minichromosome maintenance protein 10
MAGNDNVESDDEVANLEKLLLAAEADDAAEQKAKDEKVGKSLLKLDDADTSDEEDQRDFQSSKYNDFGREINKKMKEKEETRKFDSIRVPPMDPEPSTSHSLPIRPVFTDKSEVIKRLSSAPAEPAVFCDPVFGLRIVQPLVSSAILKERMEGRTSVGVTHARFHTERGDISKDWAIAGVIVNKSAVKQTKKGDAFSIWQISDLRGEIKLVTIFLFRTAHKELWKTNVGTVIGILNPKVLERKDEKVEAVLSVDNHQKLMILGQSKDLGNCRAKKNNGEVCGAIINKTSCDVCICKFKFN